MSSPDYSKAIAVYCASSLGNEKAYHNAAISVGNALAAANRHLVYGGGSRGVMGIVSGAVLKAGGQVTGVVPYAMVAAGGEGEPDGKDALSTVILNEAGREKVETIVVNSMHERKVEMAKRVGGFLGLPGGFGTFEEVLEVATWTQIGFHQKPVVLLNVLSYYDPLRELIQNGIRAGFIKQRNEVLITFVDGPSDPHAHETFDWGRAALEALDSWRGDSTQPFPFDWTKRIDGRRQAELDSM